MRIYDGAWLVREGVRPHFAREARDVEIGESEVTLYCPDRPISGRADTVDGGLLTVRLTSPAEGVIRVRLTHHEGGGRPRPRFALADARLPLGAREEGGGLVLRSGGLVVRVGRKNPFRIEFLELGADGRERLLTWTGEGRAAWLDVERGGPFVAEQLSLGVGERIYGLGERFGPLVRNGQSVDCWNEDGGASSDQAYKNVPLYVSSAGYAVFVDHPGRVSFEVGAERPSRVQFSVAGQELEYLVIAGPRPKDAVARYAALAGRPALPPAWSFGLWLTTSFTTSYDDATVSSFVRGMAERGIPLSVFHFDCFWMGEYRLCDLEWDRSAFPDPEGTLARLKAAGLRTCVWINPYIAQRSRMFAEGVAGGYLLRRPDGSVWQWDRWQAGMALVDFTNPAAREWYAAKLRALLDMGVDSFKTDFGERVPTEVRWFDGSDPERMHNYYSLMYNELVFRTVEERRGAGEALVFARAATAGGQKYPVHWGGDSLATFESMAESLRGGLSLGFAGFGFWSHDIGGFEDRASPALYKRWAAFGLLSSHSRLHGSKAYKVPWLYDEESVEVLRRFARLKCSLMPYLYACAAESAATGLPTMRAMALEFPDDEACAYLDRQYMLGPGLLVAPVFDAEGEVSYYLPPGAWTRLDGGEAVEGGRWLSERHGFMSLPLLARPGSIVPVGARDDRPDYDYAEGLRFDVYEPVEGAESVARVADGRGETVATCRARREGGLVSIRVEGRPGRYAGRLFAGTAARGLAFEALAGRTLALHLGPAAVL